MTLNLMDTVKTLLTSETVGKAASDLGESANSTRTAMTGAIPTIFAGMIHAVSTPGGATRIVGAISEVGGSEQGLMNTVFGDRSGAVTEALGKSSGVKSGTASKVLLVALPMVIGVVGKHVSSNRLSSGGLSELLLSHKKVVLDDPSTPPGLAGALKLGSLSELGGTSAPVVEPDVSTAPDVTRAASELARTEDKGVTERGKKPSRALPFAAAILAGVLIVWGATSIATRNRARNLGVTMPQATLQTSEVPAPVPIPRPEDKALNVAPESAEAEMVNYLSDGSAALPHTFNFEHLSFESGSAAPVPGSAMTVERLALVLQAYPSARVRIEGHTDTVGAPAANQALSESRASSIKDTLVAKGIAPDRIETSGEGARRAFTDDELQAGARDRRADVVLLSR